LFISFGCNKHITREKGIQSNEQIISAEGTIVYQEFEGGFFGIITDNDYKYNPFNLPVNFKRDGLRIRFEGKLKTDLVSIHMWGKLLEITGINEL
jgi:inhibitor of cysteine peptidase